MIIKKYYIEVLSKGSKETLLKTKPEEDIEKVKSMINDIVYFNINYLLVIKESKFNVIYHWNIGTIENYIENSSKIIYKKEY